jgi:hypothetical protein
MTGIQGTARTVTRRTVVAAAGVAGLSAALVACGDSDAPADSVGSGQTAADGDNDGDSDGDEATDGDKAANGSAGGGGHPAEFR